MTLPPRPGLGCPPAVVPLSTRGPVLRQAPRREGLGQKIVKRLVAQRHDSAHDNLALAFGQHGPSPLDLQKRGKVYSSRHEVGGSRKRCIAHRRLTVLVLRAGLARGPNPISIERRQRRPIEMVRKLTAVVILRCERMPCADVHRTAAYPKHCCSLASAHRCGLGALADVAVQAAPEVTTSTARAVLEVKYVPCLLKRRRSEHRKPRLSTPPQQPQNMLETPAPQ